MPAERENADHAAIRAAGEFTAVIAAARKDHRAIGKAVSIHHRQTFFKVLNAFDAQNRPKNLAAANRHLFRHMIQNRWTQVEAVFKAGNCDIPAVEHQLGAFLQSGFDPAHHRRLISRCFIADTETVSYGQHFLKIICLACPTTAVNFMVITFFQAIGKKVQPLCLSLLRKGSLDVVFMLILNHAAGVSGIAWATPFADWIAFAISVALIVPQLKRLRTD